MVKTKKTAPTKAKKRGTRAKAVGKATTKRSGKKTSQPRTKLDVALDALQCPAVAGVFPVGEDKKPVTDHGYLNATKRWDEVLALWKEHPDANVAVNLAPDYVAFDCDQKNGSDGLGELARYLGKSEDDLLRMTFTNQTPSGGYHLIFKTDRPWGQRNGVLPGVDHRGKIGYILWPGDQFVNPDTGEVGEYIRYPNGTEDFAELPRKLLKLHNPVQRKREDDVSLVEEEDADEHQQEFIEYLEGLEEEWKEDGRFEEGLRNDSMALLGALGHDFGLSEDVTVDIAAPWYEERALCEDDVETHVRSGYRSACGEHGCKTKEGRAKQRQAEAESVLDAFGAMAEKQSKKEREAHEARASDLKSHLLDIALQGDKLKDVPDREWIAPNWIPEEPACIILLGKYGVGKTTWMADKVCRLLLDQKWSPAVPAEKGVGIIWLCGEDPLGSRITLQHAYEKYGGTWPPPAGRFAFLPEAPLLSANDDGETMRTWAEVIDILVPASRRVIFVDTYHRATPDTSYNDDEAAKIAWGNAMALSRDLNAPIVTTQHPPHSTPDRPAGSMLHQANTDMTISIKKDRTHSIARTAIVTRSKLGPENGRGHTKEEYRMITDKTGKLDKFGEEIEKVRIEYPAESFQDPDAATAEENKREAIGGMVLDALLKSKKEELSVTKVSQMLSGLSYELDGGTMGELPKERTLQKDLPKLFDEHPYSNYEQGKGFDLIESSNGRVFKLCDLESDD